ncbi:hypothetical protein AAES_115169 [Amazona aestiva]|uniref:Uncharacterized protein n=1 Tax=Amazona aestiva TaxID=12930 RepID=A0A0Q3QZ75_AMAAE|nr:hypothetical protein AAES_115169 [Amazona aestiva]
MKRYKVMQHLPAEESLPGLCRARWLQLVGEELQTHAAAIPLPGVSSRDLGRNASSKLKTAPDGAKLLSSLKCITDGLNSILLTPIDLP